jgi:hypothetical protein
MRKIAIMLAIFLAITLFVPVKANKPGRIQELEARVELLENKTQDLDILETEVANLESYVNYILSDQFIDDILSQL